MGKQAAKGKAQLAIGEILVKVHSLMTERAGKAGSSMIMRTLWSSCAAILLVIAIGVIHRYLLTCDFLLYDDQGVITQNPLVTSGSFLEIFSSFNAGLYHPLTTLSWALERRLFGFNPTIFHLTNLLLHMLATLMLMLLGRRLWPGQTAAPIILAALFAFHPLHVESVAWISERKDVLCQVFFLLAMVIHMGRQPRYPPGIVRYLCVLCACVGAVLAKPMAVTLPLVLVLCDIYLDYPKLQRRLFWDKLPHLAIAMAIGIVTILGQDEARDGFLLSEGFLAGVRHAIEFLAFCLTKALWPTGLSVIYDPSSIRVGWPHYLCAAMLIGVFVVAFIRLPTWRRDGLFGLAFFGITILPVVRVVQFGDASLFNDRFFYLPGIGLCFALVALGVHGGRRFFASPVRKAALYACWGVLILLFASASSQRCQVWQNDETLLVDVLRNYPASATAHTFLAQYQAGAGRYREAADHYRAALAAAPATPLRRAGLAYNLFFDGKQQEAMAELGSALQMWPTSGEVLYTAGILSSEAGSLAAARDYLLRALDAPDSLAGPYRLVHRAYIHTTLAAIDIREERWQEGQKECAKALAYNPLLPETHYNMGLILRALHRPEEAKVAMTRALEIKPHLTEALADLAVLHFETGEEDRSLEELARAIALAPANTRYRCNLAILLQKRGLNAEAFHQFEEARRIDPTCLCARKALK